MKRFLGLLILLFSFSFLFAQDSTAKKVYIGVNLPLVWYNANVSGDALQFSPQLIVRSNKSFFNIGPNLSSGVNDLGYGQANALNGAIFSYQYLIYADKNHYHLFFEYDMVYEKASSELKWYDSYTTALFDGKWTASKFSNFIGLGFQTKYYKNFFIASHVGMGPYVFMDKGSVTSANFSRSYDHTYRQIGAIMSLSVGWIR